jgi:hypothetical protein
MIIAYSQLETNGTPQRIMTRCVHGIMRAGVAWGALLSHI